MIQAHTGGGKMPSAQSLTPIDHDATYRAADLAEYLGIDADTAADIDRLLTRPRSELSSQPYGYRCGQHVLVRAGNYLRVHEHVVQSQSGRRQA